MNKNSVYAVCLRIRAVRPAHRRLQSGRMTRPLESLQMLDGNLTWAKVKAVSPETKYL
jgi:hypothetical protein